MEKDVQIFKKNYKSAELNTDLRYYSASECGRLLGVSHNKVRDWIKQGRLPNSVNSDSCWFISEDDIDTLICNIEKEKKYIYDNFYDVREIAELSMYHPRTVANHIKQGFYNTKTIINNKYYVTKGEVHEKLNIFHKNEICITRYNAKSLKYLTTLESAEFLNVSQGRILYLIKTGRFPNAVQSDINKRWSISLIDLEEIKTLIEDEDLLKEKTYSIEEASTLLKISTDKIKRLMFNCEIRFSKIIRGKYYLLKSEIEIYQNKIINEEKKLQEAKVSKYLTFYQVNKVYGLSRQRWSGLRGKCVQGKISNSVKIGREWYIRKQDIESYIASLEQTEPDDALEAFKLRVAKCKYIDESMQNTVQMYIEWFSIIYGNSATSQPKNLLYAYFAAFETIVKNINREIYLYNNYELKFIFVKNKNFPKTHRQMIYKFFNYVRFQNGAKCSYNLEFIYRGNINSNPNKEIYSKEEFLILYNYVKNAKYHLNTGLNDVAYLRTWLYLLIHFTNTWRKVDILNFPNVSVEEIGVYKLDWFNKNTFSLAQAHIIIDQIKYKWELLDISKTGALNKFFVHLDMMIPLAVALCVMELHRRINGNKQLFDNAPTDIQIENFFKDVPQFRNFGNRFSNRSLLSHLYFSISELDATGDLAHILSKRLRGHINDESTPIYIVDNNNEGTLDLSSYHLLRRGHFGWLYSMMVDIIVKGEGKILTKEEKTNLIVKYQKIYSPQNLENMSSFLIKRQQAMRTIGMELADMPGNILKRKLEAIYNGEMPSRHFNIQCLHSNGCSIKGAPCAQCPYKIPIIYSLTSIKYDINRIIAEIEKLQENKINECKRNTILLTNLLDVLNQAVITFGKSYINVYMNIAELKEKLQNIKPKLIQ